MTILPTKFRTKGFDWEILKREGDLSIIRQLHPDGSSNYNVIQIQKQNAAEFNGVVYEEKETIPGWEQWGKKAWNFMSLESAEKYYERKIQS